MGQNPDTNSVKGVMFQTFHWYQSAGDNLWESLVNQVAALSRAGITAIWIPPVYKASRGINDVGYAVYDLWDLGEFNQKGAVRTKYGEKLQLKNLIAKAHAVGMQVYADIVLNHKDGGDEIEEFSAWPINADNRWKIKGDQHLIRSYSGFTFPGRAGKYSKMKWSWRHFAWVGHKQSNDKTECGVFRIKDILWGDEVSTDNGIDDFLLGCDIDHGDDEVRADLFAW